jgi:hypothetical protein
LGQQQALSSPDENETIQLGMQKSERIFFLHEPISAIHIYMKGKRIQIALTLIKINWWQRRNYVIEIKDTKLTATSLF